MMESHLMHEREQWGRQLQEVEEKRRKEVNALRETQVRLCTQDVGGLDFWISGCRAGKKQKCG